MSILSRSTLRMLCARSDLIRKETLEEAQRLLDVYFDPKIAPEQKEVAKMELDKIIAKVEERVTTRRLKETTKGLKDQ